MIKKTLIILTLTLIHLMSNAQTDLRVGGYWGISSSQLYQKADIVGGAGVEMKSLNEVGILLSKGFNEKWSIRAGLGYSFGEVRIQPAFCPGCGPDFSNDRFDEFKMMSFPFYAEYDLGKNFYAAVGPIIDIELSSSDSYSPQSGLGYLFGLGAKWQMGNMVFSLFPNYKRHGVLPFETSRFKHVLQELGVQLGISYRF